MDDQTEDVEESENATEETLKLCEIIKKFSDSPASPWENFGVEITSPLMAIRLNCLGCMGGTSTAKSEARACASRKCWLYPFRFGKNPYMKNRGNPNGAEALRKWRENRSSELGKIDSPLDDQGEGAARPLPK